MIKPFSALLRIVAVAMTLVLAAPLQLAAQSLLANGDMEEAQPNTDKLAGWSSFLWHGQGEISRTRYVAIGGRHSAVIDNVGPSKQAIFQRLQLPACSYRLTAFVASSGIEPGEWNQTTSVLVIYADESSKSNVLVGGDQDWRRIEFDFPVTTAQQVTLYFFNFGSGRLFVDDVKLAPLAGCPAGRDQFTISGQPVKPLGFDPPPGEHDRVLEGYCARPAFARRDVCTRLARFPKPATAPQSTKAPMPIADFEGRSPFPREIPITTTGAIAGTRSAVVKAGQYIAARNDLGLPEDWRGYDWVRFEVHNPTSTPQPFTVSIWDDKSTGYWSRVHWYSLAVPGTATYEVPLQVFVGEKSVVQERRRLDLARVRQLVFMETKADLLLDSIRLEADKPLATPFPELIALDLGTPTSPVMTGFTPLTAATVYRAGRGYGLIPGSVVLKTEDRRHPDNLHRDWISFKGGGLQFDLPNGDYKIALVLEDPGYWEYFPAWRTRSILIQEREVLAERPSYEEFLARYFRHADDEDHPGDDIWARYVEPRYRPKLFDATVAEGRLTIRFTSGDDPHATALSMLVIYPAERAREGEAFLKEIGSVLKDQFDREYRQLPAPATQGAPPAPNALGGRLWLFDRPPSVDVQSTEAPVAAELVASRDITIARDAYEPVTLTLRPVRDALDLVEAVLELPGLSVTPYRVRSKVTRETIDGSFYANKPRVLDPLEPTRAKPLRLAAGRSTRLWFDVYAPATATPGVVKGAIRLRFADGTRETIPVSANVRPWTLPRADVPIGYLGLAPIYPNANYPELAARRDRDLAQSVDLLHRFGMTALSGGLGPIAFSKYREGKPIIDFAAADRTMAAIRQRFGKTEVATYGGLDISGLSMNAPEDTAGKHKRSYGDVLKDVLDAIAVHGTVKDWSPLLHIVGDEPGEGDVKKSVAVANAIRAARKDARSGVFTSFTSASDPRAELAGPVSVVYLNHHSAEAIEYIKARGSTCSLYNRDTRYQRGVYLYKARKLGCRGHMQFAFSSVHADPWYGLDGREDEYAAVFTHPDGRLRIAVDFMRYRMAVDDYRHLLALERAVAVAPAGAARTQAARMLEQIEAAMEIGHGKPAAWADAGLDALRTAVAAQLVVLQYTGAEATRGGANVRR